MIPVTQSQLGDPKNGGEGGTCFRAALASLFEVLEAAVPDFANEYSDEEWHTAREAWLATRGWASAFLRITEEARPLVTTDWRPPGWSLLSGRSVRGFHHVVVCRDGVPVHDPHPSRAGLETVDGWYVFLPLSETFDEAIRKLVTTC